MTANTITARRLAAITCLVLTCLLPGAAADTPSSSLRLLSVVDSDSADAIIAEIERAEPLICVGCMATVTALLDDPRYEVREAAAWWYARRPRQKQAIATNCYTAVEIGADSDQARNCADILGAFLDPAAILALSAGLVRTDLSAEARAHIADALGRLGHRDANPALAAVMEDASAEVRLAAVAAWVEIREQADAAPVISRISNDSDVPVRRKAAAVVGSLRDGNGRTALEQQLANHSDAPLRRNAAWALGRIGDRASEAVLEDALTDPSGLVRTTARVALRQVRQ